MPPRVRWRPHDASVPIGQGDLVVVAWAKTIDPDEARRPGRARPEPGQRDAFDLPFWDGGDPVVLEMWGRVNYGLVVVVSEGCAIDKDFNTLRDEYLHRGLAAEQAVAQALEAAAPFVLVAEAWPVEALPEHVQRGAASGAVGYVPFSLGSLAPADTRTYAVDLSRVATVSWRAVDRRLGIADARWVLGLQSALCRFFAARTIRVSEDLADLFRQPVIQVEALSPPTGDPPRVRARLRFADGRTAILEAIVTPAPPDEPPEARRPGLSTRRETVS